MSDHSESYVPSWGGLKRYVEAANTIAEKLNNMMAHVLFDP